MPAPEELLAGADDEQEQKSDPKGRGSGFQRINGADAFASCGKEPADEHAADIKDAVEDGGREHPEGDLPERAGPDVLAQEA